MHPVLLPSPPLQTAHGLLFSAYCILRTAY